MTSVEEFVLSPTFIPEDRKPKDPLRLGELEVGKGAWLVTGRKLGAVRSRVHYTQRKLYPGRVFKVKACPEGAIVWRSK